MSPKEKAEELAASFMFMCHECDYLSKAKQCATLCVDEILEFITKYDNHLPDFRYWEEVKQEIQKL